MSVSSMMHSCFILKRDNRIQPYDSRKSTRFLKAMSWGLDIECIDITEIVASLTTRLPGDTISAEAFLIFLAEIVSTFSARHPDYSLLAGRVYACYHHRRVPKRFSTWILSFDNACPAVFTDRVIAAVREHADVFDGVILHSRDFDFTYRALQIFERSYLLKDGRELNERLQFLFMRVAIGIHGDSVDDVVETYNLLSTRMVSLASPALWNGGLVTRRFASCYIYEPSVSRAGDAILDFSTLSALWAADGGIGINVGGVPGTKSPVDGAHPGLMPLLKVYDSIAAFWSRTSRHRQSSAAAYLPVWHTDVKRFVLSRTNWASGGYRFRHIYPALWIPDLFMRRLETDATWSLFDPLSARALVGLYGDAFDAAYETYESEGLATSTLPARALWDVIADGVRESGTPFLMYADNVNAKNNQMNLGPINASNLCTEIVQHSSTIETPVCTLASLCLPRYLRADGTFDYDELHRATKLVVRYLDRLIELTDYPTADAAVAAYRTRSVSVGVQGLADLFGFMEVAYASPEARVINRCVFETIYHAALESSSELAEQFGPHDTWLGSPAQQDILQVDMWGVEPSGRHDFEALRARIRRTGLRNSVLTAQMPTASTAQLFGNSEGVDPLMSNILQFRVLGGNFNEISRPLVAALRKRGLWTDQVRGDILACRGSVQSIPGIPDDVKGVFRTAFELDPHDLVEMSADRGPFIDQSQSLSMFLASLTASVLMDVQLHAWRRGLKTGAYYVRSKPAAEPQPFGVGRSSSKTAPVISLVSTTVGLSDGPSCPCDA